MHTQIRVVYNEQPYLRNAVALLLTTSSCGSTILRDYNLNNTVITDILPDLRPALYPRRDTYAQDYAIAAMATFLGTKILVYTTADGSAPILHTFSPYPNHNNNPYLPPNPPSISILATHNHYKLLLNKSLLLPSLTDNLLPLPPSPSHNFDSKGHPITIHVSSTDHYQPWCQYAPTSNTHPQKAFCKSSCHPYCPNHYSSFRAIPHQRLPPHFVSSCLIATAGVASHTPLFQIASEIQPLPSDFTFPITPHHHSHAPAAHPLIRLMHSTNTPNCHLETFLIPEPFPHLKLFVVASTHILPYTPLRIRPPPDPPPTPSSLRGTRTKATNRSLITSYFTKLPH